MCIRDRGRTSGPPVGSQDGANDGGLLSQIGSGLEGLFQPAKGRRMSVGQAVVRSAATSAARSVGNAITRSILRGLTGGMK